MGKLCHIVLCSAVGLLVLSGARAQEGAPSKRRVNWGVGCAIGGQGLLQVEYRYRIGVLMPEMRISVRERGAWHWEAIVQPQWVFVSRRTGDGRVMGEGRPWELGLSGGLTLGYGRPHSVYQPYLGMAIGPHFLSVSIPRQSAGPAFCSQLFAGIRRRMGPRLEWDLRGGFRHVSNAGMSSPNGGINHSFLGVWLSRRV
jgi:hypothetical protein